MREARVLPVTLEPFMRLRSARVLGQCKATSGGSRGPPVLERHEDMHKHEIDKRDRQRQMYPQPVVQPVVKRCLSIQLSSLLGEILQGIDGRMRSRRQFEAQLIEA